MNKDTRQRLLDLVVARLGWKEAARRLRVDSATLDAWVSGAKRIPDKDIPGLLDILDQTNEG